MHGQSSKESVSRFRIVIIWISRVMATVSAVTLAVMMMVTVIDVMGRNFFLAPLKGAFELVGILLVIAGSWGMGYCQLLDGNIRINVLFDRFPSLIRSILNFSAFLICLAVLGTMFWQSLLRTNEYVYKDLGAITETLSMPFWPFMLMMTIGFGWAFVIFFMDIIKTIVEVVKR